VAGWTVVLRGIRYRPGRSALVLLLAAVAIASTVLAPAYARAAQQSVLSDRLAAAPATATGLQVRSDPIGGEAPKLESTTEAKLELHQLLAHRPTLRDHLAAPVGGAEVEAVLPHTSTMDAQAPDGVAAKLAYRDDVCPHLRLTAGTCGTGAGTVLVSARSATEYKINVGQSLTPRARLGTGVGAAGRGLTVAGIYDPVDPTEPYWGRTGYFAAGAATDESSLPRIDALFLTSEDDLGLPGAQPSVYLDYRLRTDLVRLDDTDRLRTDLRGFTTDVNAGQMQIATALDSVLDDIDAETASLGRTVPVVAVPLVLVCWFVLFLLVAALTDERAPEVALAKLRGYSPRLAGRFGRGEALWLVGLAAPVGVALGLSIVEISARTTLYGNVHVEVRWPVIAAAVLGIAASYLAVRLGSAATLARPALALLRRVPERTSWRAGLAEGILLGLAGGALVGAVSDQTAPLALLAPALLALVAGIVCARLVGAWSRLRVRRNARRGRLAGLLAHAQLSRRPLGHRIMLVVTVAVALLAFAATAWDVAAQTRGDVAADLVGADRVILVEAADPGALIAAVSTVDSDGTAMPAVRVTERFGDQPVQLLGVPSRQLPAVALWRDHSQADLTRLADRLRPDPAQPLDLKQYIQLDVSAAGLVGQPRLAALVAPAGTSARTVGLGPLLPGRHRYRADIAGCATDCQLLGLMVSRAVPDSSTIAAHLRVEAIGTGSGAVAAGFATAGRWRVATSRAPQATVTVAAGTALTVDLSSTDPGDVVVQYVDTPDTLPVAVAGATPADDAAATQFTFPAFGEAPQRFAVVDRESSLPRVGRRALLFDLDYAVAAAQRGAGLADNSRLSYEVWASPTAPADLSQRLAAAGLQVLGEQSIAAESDRMSRGAPALGLRLYLLAAAAALLLAVGAVLLTAYIGAGARRYELAALRVAGVRPAVLRFALLREYLLLVGVPLVVGLVAGILGAVLMLPGIPLVSVGTPVGEITYTPGPGALPGAFSVSLLGLLIALFAAVRLVRRATPDQLREGDLG
jgi:putative ABC transport system permease protein